MEYLAAVCGASAIAGVYLLSQRKKPLSNHSIQVGEKMEGETPIRRNGQYKELVSESKNCLTLYDSFRLASEEMADHPCLGIRKTIAVHKEIQKLPDGSEKPWLYFEKGPYEFITYKEAFEVCRKFSNGLRYLRLSPGDKLAIFNDTKLEWTVAEQACYMQSISILTVYATLGKDGLKYALQEAEITHLFTSGKLIPTLLEVLFECPSLKEIIYTEDCSENDLEALTNHNVSFHSYDQILKLGEENEFELTPPSPNDLCCIMYTSGSTGNPKGVMITHQSMMAAVAGYGSIFGVLDNDCYLSYLPLAHVLALVVENAVLHFGAKLGYGSTLTLTDTNMKNCKGDIRELSPTVFAGVPMVYDRIKAGIVAKIQSASFISKIIFHSSLFIKKWYLQRGLKTPILDLIVFNKFKDLLGGRMRWMVSGGAPLSPGAHLYLRACFGVPLLQGYGLTETCGAGAVMFPIDDSVGTVGPPVPCVEIKLVDVPDMGYTSNDKPSPRGEIWMRGPCITSGYFKQPEKTEEVFINGWFATGDIGVWDNSGKLKIIDRKKNLIKAPTGEYIALEKLESTLKNSNWVGNICVYADSIVTANIAIIFPQLTLVTKWFEDKGINGDLNNADLLNEIRNDLINTGKKNGLLHFEQITNVILTPNEWTPESGFLTAAMKLQRRNIYQHFDNEIQHILAEKNN